jgi:ferredoxin-NADP reductase
VGDIIDVAPPSGRFVLSDSPLPLTLFAAGSGITPVISILKQALKHTDLTVRLLYANSNRQQIIFAEELDDLAAIYPERFQCQHHISSEQGRVNETTIESFLAESLDNDFYICGPAPFMDLVEGVLEKFGIADNHIYTERFISDVEIKDEQETVGGNTITTFTAILDGEYQTVPHLAGKTLLESMLTNDLKPAYFCQQARCGMCTVHQTAGEVMMRNSDILSDNDKEKGQILLCQSIPLSEDIVVDCDKH